MVTSVRSRSDHYETLRVARTASSAEITNAFASQMLTARMRPDITVARLAKLSVAYETLRDPAKRRAYDASLSLESQPSPVVTTTAGPFIGGSTLERLNRLADPSPSAAEVPPGRSASEPGAGSRVADFIAASLRPQADLQETELRPSLSPEREPALRQEVAVEPPVTVFDESAIEEGRFSIGRTGATLAACVVGVAILSVALALPASNPDRLPTPPAPVKPVVTVPLPPVAAVEDRTAAPPASVAVGRSARLHASVAAAATVPKAQPARPDVVDGQEPRMVAANAEPAALQSSTEQAGSTSPEIQTATPADSTIVTAAAASLPLSNATIARTIERIGYSCGRIAASEPVDGASPGVFKITCSSGDTYQATPIRGRYHFRRLGGR